MKTSRIEYPFEIRPLSKDEGGGRFVQRVPRSLAKLDMEHTTPAVSLSIPIGLVYIPVLILLFQ